MTTKDAGSVIAPAATATFTLPDAAQAAGCSFTFIKQPGGAGVTLTVQRAGADVILDGGTAAGGYPTHIANSAGEYGALLEVRSRVVAGAAYWVVERKTGTWVGTP